MGMPTYGVGFNVDFAIRYVELAPLSVDATVAIVGTGASKHMKYYPSVKLALASNTDYPNDSTAREALLDLQACGTECKVIISAYVKDNDDNTAKNNALEAFEALKDSETLLGQLPTFIMAPGLRGKAYFDKMKTVADSLKCIFFWDTEKKTLTEIKNELSSCKSPRAVTACQDVLRSDANNTVRPFSGFILGNWLRLIFSGERGLAQTFSNKTINGITGIRDIFSHSYTEDKDSTELRQNGVTAAIRAPGMLFWGDGVREERAIGYRTAREQLIVDLLQKRIEEAFKVFIDEPVTEVMERVLSMARRLCEDLKGRNIIFQYDVQPDITKNTPANVFNGKIWTIVKIQMTSFCKYIGVNVTITDEFSKQLIAASA